MKKIIFIIITLLSILVSNNDCYQKKISLNENIKSENYYISRVPYIDHDDFFYENDNKEIVNTVIKDEIKMNLIKENNNIKNTDDIKYEPVDNKVEILDSDDKEIGAVEEIISDVNYMPDTKNEIDENLNVKEDIVNEQEESRNKNVINSTNKMNTDLKNNLDAIKKDEIIIKDKVKVIDVSYHQGVINWDLFKESNEYYGVILRIGYYNKLDKKFLYNLEELRRLDIPYGIYLFSYALDSKEALIESNFVNKMCYKYNLKPKLGIYYDLESFITRTKNSNMITKKGYDNIVTSFVNNLNSDIKNKYNIGVYSSRWYAMNRFGHDAKKYVKWVAEYNSKCKYDDFYYMWQYTSKGKVPGIKGNVDISYLYYNFIGK